jgi:hypothetical protein
MSIRIIAKGDRLFKQDMDRAEGEVEIHGDEKSFYLKELGKIDSGQGGGARITNAHRDYCKCHECLSPEDIENIRREEEAVNRGH